jgi:phage terminase large subunit-like protein
VRCLAEASPRRPLNNWWLLGGKGAGKAVCAAGKSSPEADNVVALPAYVSVRCRGVMVKRS